MTLLIRDADAMEVLGGELARCCPYGVLINLRGELGTGKTTLVRGFLRGLGYTGIVKSPTYTLVESYELPQGKVYHFDLYRLQVSDELEAIGVRDYLDGTSTCLVEWPERAGDVFVHADLGIQLIHDGNARIVELDGLSATGRAITTALAAI